MVVAQHSSGHFFLFLCIYFCFDLRIEATEFIAFWIMKLWWIKKNWKRRNKWKNVETISACFFSSFFLFSFHLSYSKTKSQSLATFALRLVVRVFTFQSAIALDHVAVNATVEPIMRNDEVNIYSSNSLFVMR